MAAVSHIIHVHRRWTRRSGNQAADRVSCTGRRRDLRVRRSGAIEAGIEPGIAEKRRLVDDLPGAGRGMGPAGLSDDALIDPVRRTSCARIHG